MTTTLRTAALAAALAIAASTVADDRAWNAPEGGIFNDPGSWEDFIVPSASDRALFDLANAYTVVFDDPDFTDRLRVGRGVVTFDLTEGVLYTLNNGSIMTPGLEVGTLDGDVASLEVSGGQLRATWATIGGAGGLGILDVLDDAAWLDVDEEVRVGFDGTGFVTLANGGRAYTGGVILGQLGGDYGSIFVGGAGTSWTSTGALVLGDRSLGSMTVSDGAVVAASSLALAKNPGSIGELIVEGGHVAIDGPADVGMRSGAIVILRDGATMACRDFATIGTFPDDMGEFGGTGTVVVEGTGSTWTIHGGFFDGDLLVGHLSQGSIELRAGGRVLADGAVQVTDTGALDEAIVEIAGDDDYASAPAIDAGGAVWGTLALRLADGYEPTVGTIVLLVRAASNHASVELPALPAGLAWGVSSTPTELRAYVVPSSCADAVATDCNANGIDDQCDIDFGGLDDCDADGIPDVCELPDHDCDGNGVLDACDIAAGAADCNGNGILDSCETLAQNVMLDAGAPGANLARAVAAQGDRVVVGAPDYGDFGAAHVYRLVAGTWVLEATLAPPPGLEDLAFGSSVAIDGDRILVGAPRYPSSWGEGAAWLFEYDGAAWTRTQRLEADGVAVEQFGDFVAIDGDVAAIGGKTADFEDPDGLVVIYRRDGGAFENEHTFLVGDLGGFSLYGATVALAGDVVVAGYRETVGKGRVKILEYADDAWSLARQIDPPFPHPDASFGEGVYGVPLATDGTRIAIGGAVDGDDAVFLLRRNEEDWTDEAILYADAPDTRFGRSVGLMGDDLVVGADRANDDRGVVHAYRRDAGAWERTATYEALDDTFRLGTSVDLSSGRLATGSDDMGAYVITLGDGDCNENGVPDGCDILAGTSPDVNANGVPDECEALCPADLDASGAVDFQDLLLVLTAWGPCPDCPEDLDGDGVVGFLDLLTILSSWGACS